jgi:hypothetical protein
MRVTDAADAALEPPHPPDDLNEHELEALIERLESHMPVDSMIHDLRDWDVRLYDLLADDWFFGAALGPESLVKSYADDLAIVFREQVEKLDLDYDQHRGDEEFADLVTDEALKFTTGWRRRICEAALPRRPGQVKDS